VLEKSQEMVYVLTIGKFFLSSKLSVFLLQLFFVYQTVVLITDMKSAL